jgi:hypothetical protein
LTSADEVEQPGLLKEVALGLADLVEALQGFLSPGDVVEFIESGFWPASCARSASRRSSRPLTSGRLWPLTRSVPRRMASAIAWFVLAR